ncbi:pantoate--beta-alanine ligase [Fuchsiella alkaliacetigena]|uniref:pantoate--beta-alanine ligase n=1 Tax=Fuchsiella alkaliacetigena TaxID=957042 RepID=UPI00200ADEEF|nr:pantoate--beta-alanine ligase [Fuchsiella alkaliacetigena]MCK8824893.1 pantoate--beta-alanine ligase [Fuchsiella alkaliacetigena]
MEVCRQINEVREFVKEQKREGQEVGFVPTMGYLHQGHLSLMKEARKDNDIVVVSIFVNPTQFEPDEDYEEYPRDLERDLKLAAEVGVDLVFAPEVEEVYSTQSLTTVQVADLSDRLCGESRPNHFTGVCTIVSKLFNIVGPDRAYFGQKDAQQVLIIKRLVKDLNFEIEIVTVPIAREKDGLAISSRNKYLNESEREAALVLYNSLQLAKKLIIAGEKNAEIIKTKIVERIKGEPLAELDYVEIVDQNTLASLSEVKNKVLIALAVYIGQTRLIDNIMLEVETEC